jgi:amino acid permease
VCIRNVQAIYYVVGLVCYMTFGADTKGNLLENYGSSTSLAIGKSAFGFTVLLTCPVLYFVLRISLENLLFKVPETVGALWQEEGESASLNRNFRVPGVLSPEHEHTATARRSTKYPKATTTSSTATATATATAIASSHHHNRSSNNAYTSDTDNVDEYVPKIKRASSISTNSSRMSYLSDTNDDEIFIETEEWFDDSESEAHEHTTVEMLVSLARPTALSRCFPAKSWQRRIMILLLVWVPVTLVASFVSSPQLVLSYVGSTGGALVVYILPPVFFLQLDDGKWYSLPKLLAMFLGACGVIFGMMGIIFTTTMAK